MSNYKMKKIIFFSVLLCIVFSILGNLGLADEEGSSSVNFFTSQSGSECVKDSFRAYWLNKSNLAITWVYNSTFSGDPYLNGSLCCPIGFVPYTNDDKESSCIRGTGVDCTSKLTKEECNGADPSLSYSFLEKDDLGICTDNRYEAYIVEGLSCANASSCSCFWNQSLDNGDGLCTNRKNVSSCCGDSTCTEDNVCCKGSSSSYCGWYEEPDTREDNCGEDNGKIIIHYGADGNAVDCISQALEYPCSVSVKLPFFDKFSFIFAALAIVGVYFFTRRK